MLTFKEKLMKPGDECLYRLLITAFVASHSQTSDFWNCDNSAVDVACVTGS